MPQTAEYRVSVGLRHGGSFSSRTIHLAVPDIVTQTEVERQLHEKLQDEWRTVRANGAMFDMERLSSATLHDGWDCLVAVGDESWDDIRGRVAINPDEIAWLQVAVLSLIPLGTGTPPA